MSDVDENGEDKIMWTVAEKEEFIRIMVPEVRKGHLTSTIFHRRIFTSISLQMKEKFKKNYAVDKLRQMYNRLRAKWKLFKDLTGSTGFGWDSSVNTVTAPEETWARNILENKEYRQFKKKGLDHFDLLTEIFAETVATGALTRGHAQGPLTSEEEHEVEEVFLYGGKGKSVPPTDADDVFEISSVAYLGDSPKRSKRKSKRSKSSSDASTPSAYEVACEAFTDAQQRKASLTDKQSEALNTSGQSTIVEWMQKLEATEGLSKDEYVRAINALKSDFTMRLMFVLMFEDNRRAWITSL